MVSLIRDDVGNYIKQLVGDKRPKKIIVCMVYFPGEVKTESWANPTLKLLMYDWYPAKLQSMMRYLKTLKAS